MPLSIRRHRFQNTRKIMLCPSQGIIFRGTLCPAAAHWWCKFWSLDKGVALFLHWIVIFSLACNKQSVDRHFKTMQIFCSSPKAPHPYPRFSIHHSWFLTEVTYYCDDFPTPALLSYLLVSSWLSTICNSLPLLMFMSFNLFIINKDSFFINGLQFIIVLN